MQLFKLRNIILYFIYFYFIFLNNLLAETLNESGANVFMYHRFDESKYPSTNINTDQLEDHLIYLIDNEFNIESIDEILQKKILNNHSYQKQLALQLMMLFCLFTKMVGQYLKNTIFQ